MSDQQELFPASGPPGRWPDLFDEFWAAYPRKVAKEAARRSWRGLLRRYPCTNQEQSAALLGRVLRVLSARVTRSWHGRDAYYIPHASTFLNQEAFDPVSVTETCPARPVDQPKGAAEIIAEWRWSRYGRFAAYLRGRAESQTGRPQRFEAYLPLARAALARFSEPPESDPAATAPEGWTPGTEVLDAVFRVTQAAREAQA